ncbi:hypothetical protein F2Q70_00003543 [Brassica cretica]|uniref:Uncharacterized protein n=1 Tax=Brassica cretica TaxID=69181 RepID=A0A8S9IVG0_BRACR|nr:hypothetical protein F2Q70_00003543 [Brassica cretica]
MEETERNDGFSRDDTEEFNKAWIHGRVITGMVQKTYIFGFLCFGFLPPGSGFLPPGLGSCPQVPGSYPQVKIYAHCSTSTTLLTGSGHDIQLISRVPPCSLKHLDTSCSLQHIDRSTICSGHVPPRTDDSYQLQSYVLPRLRAH